MLEVSQQVPIVRGWSPNSFKIPFKTLSQLLSPASSVTILLNRLFHHQTFAQKSPIDKIFCFVLLWPMPQPSCPHWDVISSNPPSSSPSSTLALSMTPHSSTLAWKIPRMEEPGKLQSWGHKESDTTEPLQFYFSLSCIGEGNGNPLHSSCLENPRDRGAWWAAVYGVTQSRTRLKQLSSSSSSNALQGGKHTVPSVYHSTLCWLPTSSPCMVTLGSHQLLALDSAFPTWQDRHFTITAPVPAI